MYILSSYDKMQLSGDMSANYRQESNFFWLTKINQSGWMLVRDLAEVDRLVRPDLSDIEKKFDGYLSDEAALSLSGAAEVWSLDKLKGWLGSLDEKSTIGALKPLSSEDLGMTVNPSDERVWAMIEGYGLTPRDIREVFAAKRAIKSGAEVDAMRRSVDSTIEVFNLVRSQIDSFGGEADINAEMTAEFLRRGGEHAYQPIIASGVNACTLHYVDNNQPLSEGSFVLMDVGINIDGYNADITRTYAIGQVSDRHRQVHAAVGRALHRVISIIKPGLSLKDYIDESSQIVLTELIGLGLAENSNDTEALRRYMPHSISHGLGIDVHESLLPHREFKSGMVLTVEPGIYIEDERIGVRLEDNILVTDSGNLNLSKSLPTSM